MNPNNKEKTQTPEINKSKFFIKSIGYAASNLPLDSNQLEVLPIEEFGYVDGEINDHRNTLEETGIDAKGNQYSDKIETSNSMVAEWLPWGSNRYSAPNVRRGERVLLWQYADTDKYYWSSMGLDDHLRRRETLVISLSNTVDENVTELNSTNTYSMIASTHTKEVTIQTTKTDGEPFSYIIKLDTKNGMFVVTDDDDNQITMESAERRITLVNGSGSTVVLDKKNIKLEAVETLDLVAKTVNITATTLNNNAITDNVNSTTHNLNAATANINADAYKMIGGAMDFSGGKLIVGTGSEFNGSIMNNGVNIGSTHTHSGVRSGGDTSSTPK